MSDDVIRRMFAEGASDAQIAEALWLAPRTIERRRGVLGLVRVSAGRFSRKPGEPTIEDQKDALTPRQVEILRGRGDRLRRAYADSAGWRIGELVRRRT